MSAFAAFLGEIFERLFEEYEHANCSKCGGSGFYLPGGVYSGQGAYDMVCPDCGGQSTYADTSYFVRGAL